MKHFQFSNKGSQRSINEDSLLSMPGKGFFLVVDGVGKSSGAARDVAESFSELTTSLSSNASGSRADCSSILREGFLRANLRLIKRSRDEGIPCCAAAAAVIILNGQLAAGWCGDCRLYKVSASGVIKQLTTDHTRLADLIKRDVVALDEVDPSMRKSALTRTLGDKDEVDCEILAGINISAGDKFFLCTDGVSDSFSDSDFKSFLVDSLNNLTLNKETDTVSDMRELEQSFSTKFKLAEDDHTGIVIFIEKKDVGSLVSNDLVDKSIDQVSSGLKNEIQRINANKANATAREKRQSLKEFVLSIPSMSRKQLLGEIAVIGVLFGAVFLSPKIIEIAGQRMESISLEFFLVAAIVLYFLVLKLRLKFMK